MEDKTVSVEFLRRQRDIGGDLPLIGMRGALIDAGFPTDDDSMRKVMGLMTGYSFELGCFFYNNIDYEVVEYISSLDEKPKSLKKQFKGSYTKVVREIALDFLSTVITLVCEERIDRGEAAHHRGFPLLEEDAMFIALEDSIEKIIDAYYK